MSKDKNRYREPIVDPNVIPSKRCPKGWVAIGSNSITVPYKSYVERQREVKRWNRMMIEAERYHSSLKEEVEKYRSSKRRSLEDENESNAETLVEKKYRKDKTQTKISNNTVEN